MKLPVDTGPETRHRTPGTGVLCGHRAMLTGNVCVLLYNGMSSLETYMHIIAEQQTWNPTGGACHALVTSGRAHTRSHPTWMELQLVWQSLPGNGQVMCARPSQSSNVRRLTEISANGSPASSSRRHPCCQGRRGGALRDFGHLSLGAHLILV